MVRSLILFSLLCVGSQSDESEPFTHSVYILVYADPSTIKFEKAKLVEVRTPAGTRVSACEVTYSYTGPALASDEHGDPHFTFKVYFKPDELSPEVQQALTTKNQKQANRAGWFTVSVNPDQGSVRPGYNYIRVDPSSQRRE